MYVCMCRACACVWAAVAKRLAVYGEFLAPDKKRMMEALLQVSALSALSVDVLRIVAEYTLLW